MRIIELLEQELQEGGKSGPVRYNSEVGMLVGMCGINPATFDPKNPGASMAGAPLENSAKIFKDIVALLAPNFDPQIFNTWVAKGRDFIGPISKKLEDEGDSPASMRFGWAGGSNKGSTGAADITFHGVNIQGVSIKAEGGITLANLTPKALGLTPDRGSDIFYHYAQPEYIQMKKDIFNAVLAAARQKNGQTLDPTGLGKYTITFDPTTQKFTCTGKKSFEGTDQEILDKVAKNAKWQRVFGDWFQVNYAANKNMSSALYSKISTAFEQSIKQHLSQSAELLKVLQFAKIPYFYASTTGLYFVPSSDAVADLSVLGFTYGRITEGGTAQEAEGTSQLFTARIGTAGSTKFAELDIYIRYANGMFESNPTVRVQNLRNPTFMSWVKLTP